MELSSSKPAIWNRLSKAMSSSVVSVNCVPFELMQVTEQLCPKMICGLLSSPCVLRSRNPCCHGTCPRIRPVRLCWIWLRLMLMLKYCERKTLYHGWSSSSEWWISYYDSNDKLTRNICSLRRDSIGILLVLFSSKNMCYLTLWGSTDLMFDWIYRK
jgi:hypothetical protein